MKENVKNGKVTGQTEDDVKESEKIIGQSILKGAQEWASKFNSGNSKGIIDTE